MPFVLGRADSAFDFDALVQRLREAFPQTTTISDDYYADRVSREKANARQQGMPVDCAPIRSTQQAALKHGTQRHLSIAISDETTLDTRIDKMGILAVGGQDTVKCRNEIQKLLDILTTFPLQIEASWDGDK